MGNSFFTDVNAALGHYGPGIISSNGDGYSSNFSPTNVQGVATSCIKAFEGTPGVDYSSIATRSNSFLFGAISELIHDYYNITLDNYGCEADKFDSDLVRCDWSKIYVRIVQECRIANIRGGAYDYVYYGMVAGDCEELLGISDKIMEDGVLDPDTEWCPAYYGKEGPAVYASVGMSRTFGDRTGFDSMTDLVESTIGADYYGDTQKIIIDNVPYCTAFDSCTDEDFFKLANAEAADFAEYQKDDFESYYNSSSYSLRENIIKIIPDKNVCKDSKLRLINYNDKAKTCKWVGRKQGRCTRKKFQKHCPETCKMCEDFACVDSPLSFGLWGSGDVVNCEWVGEDPQGRCKKGTRTVCRETCGFCDAMI